MRSLPDRLNRERRPKFISRNGLLLILTTVVVISWLVYPRSLFFERDNGSVVSPLSLAYLKVILAKNEDDFDTRLRLADQQMRYWQVDSAWNTISPLLQDNRVPVPVAEIMAIKIRYAQLTSRNLINEPSHPIFKSVTELLDRVLDNPLKDEQIALIAASMGKHKDAANLYRQLYERDSETEYLRLAGKQFLAAQAPDEAADMFRQMYAHSPELDVLFDWANAALGGSMTASKLDWYLSVEPTTESLKYWQYAAQLSLATPSVKAFVKAKEETYALTQSPDDRGELINIYLGEGLLKKAVPLVRQQLAGSPSDVKIRQRLRDLYLWMGDIPNYLVQVRWLAQYNPDPQEIAAATPLAIGAFRFDDATWLFENLAEIRPLSEEELTNWFESYYQAGTAEEGAQAMRQYMDKYGPSAHLVSLLARVADDLGDYQQLLSDWTQYGRFFQLPPSTYQLYSGALWQEGDYMEALQVLENVPEKDRNAAFWKLYGDIAWLGEQAELAIEAYRRHIVLAPERDSESAARLEILLARYDEDAYLDFLVNQFNLYGIPHYLLLAADILLQRDEIDYLSKLMLAGEQNGALDKMPVLRTYQSWVLQLQGNPLDAIVALRKANQAEPEQPTIQLALLWALLEHGDRESLRDYLSHLAPIVQSRKSFWQPMALSYERLNAPRDALLWYERFLNAEPHHYETLFNYAQALKTSGYKVASFNVKQYMLRQLMQHLDEFWELPAFVQLSLRTEFQGITSALNAPELYARGNEHLLINYLIDANQRHAAQQYYKAFSNQLIDLDDNLTLRIALLKRDREQVEALLAKGLDFPPADKFAALSLLGRKSEAIELGEAELNNAMSDNAQQQLRGQLVEAQAEYPHVLQASFGQLSAFDQQNTRITYSVPWSDAHYWQASLTQTNFASVEFEAGSVVDLPNHVAWENQWRWQDEDDEFSISTNIAWGEDWRRDGVSIVWTRQWQHALNTQGYLQLNQLSRASRLASALAQTDVIGLNTNWQITSRESLSLEIQSLDYSTHYKDALGQGNNLSLTLSEQLFRQDPSIDIYFNWQWQHNDLLSDPLTKVSNALGSVSLSANDFFPAKYGRIALGGRVYRGQPSALGRATGSPRLFIDANVGYLYFDKEPDFGISAGAGWRVQGDDELSVTAQYQSANLQGNSNFHLTLNYQIYFD